MPHSTNPNSHCGQHRPTPPVGLLLLSGLRQPSSPPLPQSHKNTRV